MSKNSTISKTAVVVYLGLFAFGALCELVWYVSTRDNPAPAVYKDINAIPGHLVLLAVVLLVLAIGAKVNRPALLTFLKWPFTPTGLQRTFDAALRLPRDLFGFGSRSLGARVLRLPFGLLSMFAVLLMAWSFIRSGEELIGNLDHAWRINAYGGPTWAGAVGAHWLDAAVMFYVCSSVVVFGTRDERQRAGVAHSSRRSEA